MRADPVLGFRWWQAFILLKRLKSVVGNGGAGQDYDSDISRAGGCIAAAVAHRLADLLRAWRLMPEPCPPPVAPSESRCRCEIRFATAACAAS